MSREVGTGKRSSRSPDRHQRNKSAGQGTRYNGFLGLYCPITGKREAAAKQGVMRNQWGVSRKLGRENGKSCCCLKMCK